jgi:hypothetical protein
MMRIAMTAVALAVLTAACGGCTVSSGNGNGPPGVDRSKPVSSVTEADKSALCDWFAPMVGGYGSVSACAEGFLTAPPDKATCLADFPVCAVTIGVFEDCVVAIVAAQNACTPDALTAVMMRADCAAVGAGGCFD